jgi:6-pyruvoyltetrahydropterin/6-carboxytetrahydropterin synthase
MRVSVTKIVTFDSAHYLPGYEGKCANMHGHTYKLEVTVEHDDGGNIHSGSQEGMVIDFSDFKDMLNRIVVEPMDHKVLNEVLPYRPTAEYMAKDIMWQIERALESTGLVCKKVRLWETPTSYAEAYHED